MPSKLGNERWQVLDEELKLVRRQPTANMVVPFSIQKLNYPP